MTPIEEDKILQHQAFAEIVYERVLQRIEWAKHLD